MWTVTAEGPVDKVYGDLRRNFDRKYVPRETVTLKGGHTKEQHLSEKDGGLDAATSLQFRLALKSIQLQLAGRSGKVKVTLKGDETSMATKVEVA